MTFERSWVLLFCFVPIVWVILEWRRTSRRGALILKALTFISILIALSEPQLSVSETKMAVAVLVDTSASVSANDLARASQFVTRVEESRGRHWTRVLPFARNTRDLDSSENGKPRNLKYTAGDPGNETDFEAAIREAITALPPGMVPRIVLISDGKENAGSVTRAAWQAQQLGIPIDTVSLSGRPQPALRLDSVSLPMLAFTGERFPVDLMVSSPKSAEGTVEIFADGKSLGANPVSMQAGENRVRAQTNLTAVGALDLAVVLKAPSLGEVRFDQAITLQRPRVLYVSQDPVNTEANLLQNLRSAEFEVVRTNDLGNEKLGDYQLLALNNQDLEAIPSARKDDIEKFVKEGGGLLVIGGERNIYAENKKVEDALDRSLPAKLAPPRSPEGTCVILIIDKSSSMEGRKIELARLASIGVVDHLRPVDMVGVLIFDNSFQWAVPVRRAEDRTLIKRLIAGITPDGGTQIAPALSEAFHKILPVTATYKHIVLLTDGISEEGDSLVLSREALAKKVTISTVGLGQDVNRAYLEKVASSAGGKAYFLTEPSGLEQILLRDVMEHTGTTAVEKPLKPEIAKQAEILEGVGMESAPALKGYVKFIAKPSADTILTLDEKDPLLSRWQYGLGRSAVFASDAKSRWAADWITWKGYDRFWTNVFRDLLPHMQPGEATAEFDSASDVLVVNYRISPTLEEPKTIPGIFVIGPNGFQQSLPVKKIAAGSYRGELPLGHRQGLFRIRPLQDSKAFPEVGLYRQEAELTQYGSNEPLLKQIAEFTGGRFHPSPAEVFRAGGKSIPSAVRLWPGLLAAAVFFNLAELLLRKGKGVLQTIRTST